MKSRLILNLFLLVCIIGFGVFAFLYPKVSTPPPIRLSTLQPETIQSLRIEGVGQPPISFEKKANTWHMIAPIYARADPNRISRLLEILSAASETRLPASNLERFELDKPGIQMTIGGQVFRFGMLSPLANEVYVATGGSVYLLPAKFGSVSSNAGEYLSRRLFAEDQKPIGFELDSFKVMQDKGRWIVSPQRGEFSQDDANRWVEDWRTANAMDALPLLRAVTDGEFIMVKLSNGKTVKIVIMSREPELVLVRQDEQVAYRFPPAIGKYLMAGPAPKEVNRNE